MPSPRRRAAREDWEDREAAARTSAVLATRGESRRTDKETSVSSLSTEPRGVFGDAVLSACSLPGTRVRAREAAFARPLVSGCAPAADTAAPQPCPGHVVSG